MKTFELIVRNMNTKRHSIQIIELETEDDAYEYFGKFWSQDCFMLVNINEVEQECDFKVGDYVQIITGIGDDKTGQNYTDHLVEYVGEKGVIVDINEVWDDHHCKVEFDNEKLNKPSYLWRKLDIRKV